MAVGFVSVSVCCVMMSRCHRDFLHLLPSSCSCRLALMGEVSLSECTFIRLQHLHPVSFSIHRVLRHESLKRQTSAALFPLGCGCLCVVLLAAPGYLAAAAWLRLRATLLLPCRRLVLPCSLARVCVLLAIPAPAQGRHARVWPRPAALASCRLLQLASGQV